MDNLIQNLTCYNGTVLVETIKESAGKFELPETADRKTQKGKVILISEDADISDFGIKWLCPIELGQTIYYRNWSSQVFDLGGRDYVVVKFRDIIMSEK